MNYKSLVKKAIRKFKRENRRKTGYGKRLMLAYNVPGTREHGALLMLARHSNSEEGLMVNKTYKRDGMWLLNGTLDGPREPYTGLAVESREYAYEVLRGSTGRIRYFVNCREVQELPSTPLTRRLLEEFNG